MQFKENARLNDIVIAKRSPTPYILATAISSVFPIAWIANWHGYANIEVADTLWATLFVWCFASPVVFFSAYSSVISTPYIEVVGSKVQFCSMNTPWKFTELDIRDIIELSTEWTPYTTRCMISLRLSDSAYKNSVGDWTWVKRSKGWVYFHLVNSSTDPHTAAKALSVAAAVPYIIENGG